MTRSLTTARNAILTAAITSCAGTATAQMTYDFRRFVTADSSINIDGQTFNDELRPTSNARGSVLEFSSEVVRAGVDNAPFGERAGLATVRVDLFARPDNFSYLLSLEHTETAPPNDLFFPGRGRTNGEFNSRGTTGIRFEQVTRYQMFVTIEIEESVQDRISRNGQTQVDVSSRSRPDARVSFRGDDLFETLPPQPILLIDGWADPRDDDTTGLEFAVTARLNSDVINLTEGDTEAREELRVLVEVKTFDTRKFACSIADMDSNGTIDTTDFSLYLSDWSASAPRADLTSGGTCDIRAVDGIVDMSDFACFLSQWSAGCL